MASRRNKIRLAGLIAAAVIAVALLLAPHYFSPRARAKRMLDQVASSNKPIGKAEKIFRHHSRRYRRYRDGLWAQNFMVGPDKNPFIEKLLALGPDARPVLIEAANAPDPSVRICAMRALTDARDPRAFDILIAAIDDKDPKVRAGATLCLGRVKDERAFDVLVKRLKHKEGYLAAMALGKLGDQRAVQPLIDAISKLPTAGWAVHALNELDPRRAVGPLTDALANSLQGTDKFSKSRTASLLEALAKPSFPLEDARLPGLLAQAAGHSDLGVRIQAAKVLGRLSDPQAAETLRGLLNDSDVRVRQAAAEGVKQQESRQKDAQKPSPPAG